MEGFLHVELFHAAFHHDGLLHVGDAVTPQERTKGRPMEPSPSRVLKQTLPGPPPGVPYPKITS
jgi:hypothetical protein